MSNALSLSLPLGQLICDGAARAAQFVPLLFALNAAQPAAAQLPRELPPVTVTAPAIVPLETGAEDSPLTLQASHVDIRIVGAVARVRTTLTWRNDGKDPVDAHYRVPLPARLAWLQQPGVADDLEIGGCGDPMESPLVAALDDESVEAGESVPGGHGQGLVRLAPGEEVRVTVERETELLARGDRHRLVLPLYTQRNAAFTPQFTATASIDTARPVVELASPTHPAEISGVGDTQARLVIPGGRVHEGQFLAIDFTLGDEALPAAFQAPVVQRWGGESFTRIASR